MYGFGMGIAWVWPLLLVLVLAVVVWALIRASRANGGRASTAEDRPREILQERFALAGGLPMGHRAGTHFP